MANLLSLYYFMKAEYLFSNLRQDRIKLSVPEKCNDPLEFSPRGKCAAEATEGEVSAKDDLGFVSFSKDFSNSVMWGHYADSHKGVCLQFDIPISYVEEADGHGGRKQSEQFFLIDAPFEERQYLLSTKKEGKYYALISKIKYDLFRPNETQKIVIDSSKGKDVCVRVTRPFTQKSSDWQYEQEYRLFAALSRCEYDEGNYFLHGLNKHLKCIILGKKCSLSEAKITREITRMGERGKELKRQNILIKKAEYSSKYYSLTKEEEKERMPEPSVSIILNQENVHYLESRISKDDAPPSLRDFVAILQATITEQKKTKKTLNLS